MLRQRRPPALWGTVEAPTTATLFGFVKQSSGCVTRPGSSALEAWRALFRERARAFLGVLGLVDEGGDGGVVAEGLFGSLGEPAPGQLLGDLHGERPVRADALRDLGRGGQESGGLDHAAHEPDLVRPARV